MQLLIITLIPLLILGQIFRLLNNRFYILHIAISCVLAFAVGSYFSFSSYSKNIAIIALVIHLLCINLITLFAYYWDKRASIKGYWRVPEKTLQTFALLGGTPSALIAQIWFRHKNNKTGFKQFFWLIAGIQLSLLGMGIYVFWKNI